MKQSAIRGNLSASRDEYLPDRIGVRVLPPHEAMLDELRSWYHWAHFMGNADLQTRKYHP